MQRDNLAQGQTQRPPASALLLIDSLDRYKYGTPGFGLNGGTTSSQWTTQLQQYVLSGYFTRLALTQIFFQWNLPTIIQGYNDSFDIDVSGTPYVITLDEGFYTPNGLAQEIEDQLDAATPLTWTVTYSGGVFNISNPSDDWYPVNPAWVNPGGVVPADELVSVRALTTLGLQNIEPTDADTLLLGGVPTMLPTRFIDILSSYLTKFQTVKDSSTTQVSPFISQIARIYPVAPNTRVNLDEDGGPTYVPFQICIDYNTPKHINWNFQEAISNFDIQLRDEFGELVPWSRNYGCEYSLTCLATEN